MWGFEDYTFKFSYQNFALLPTSEDLLLTFQNSTRILYWDGAWNPYLPVTVSVSLMCMV